MAVNTIATYLRSLLAVGLALFSSRWILQALGATDFGLFNVVGSLIVFLTFFNSVMASSAARHFAYAIGKGDADDLNKWFNTSLSIHLILPAVLIVIGWPIAEYVIRNVLTIPAERVDACVIVFRISLIGAFVNMASIPFVAMFTAKQRITEIAFWGVTQSFMVFILAWVLTRVSSDRLLFYAANMIAIHVLLHCVKITRAICLFSECHVKLQIGFDARYLMELFRFAAWNVIAISGITLRNQGSTILLNLYFGPQLNSAFGIANQLSQQVNQLSGALMTAIVPEMTSREGRGKRTLMLQLAHQSTKYAFLLVLFFAIPLITEMDLVLKLWLHDPPAHTSIFCRFIIISFLIGRLTATYSVAVNAGGKIAGFQATAGLSLVFVLPLALLLFSLGYPPASLGVAYILSIVVYCCASLFWMRRLYAESVRKWWNFVATPCLMISLVSFLAVYIVVVLMQESVIRLLLNISISTLTILLATWFFGLQSNEKLFFKKILHNKKTVINVGHLLK